MLPEFSQETELVVASLICVPPLLRLSWVGHIAQERRVC